VSGNILFGHTSCLLHYANKPSQSSLGHSSEDYGFALLLSLLTGERPNTDATFSVSVGSEPLRPSPANVLRAVGIADLLKSYPNQRFVDTLISIAMYGACIGFRGNPSGRVQCPNHASAFAHPEIIEQSIQSELQKGRLKQISSLPSNAFCSPIGLVPKHTDGIQSGWRVIFDLSSPEGASVNDGIPKEYGTLVYETLNDAIRLIAQAGKGAMLVKRDLKSAFRHIPVSPCDYWLLLFEWNGQFFVDIFLPFGLRTAPRIFNLFAEALHWVFETLFEWNVTHYLDDFLFVFPPNADVNLVSNQFDSVLTEFGLTKAIEKDSEGSVVVHLGFEFDTQNMQVRLPSNKKQRAIDAVDTLLSSRTVTYTMLETTLGFLSHCCQVVPLGRPFLRNLFSQLCRKSSHRHTRQLRLTSNSRHDLRWWRQFLLSWSTISLIQLSRTCFDVATDASGTKGIGGVYNRLIFSERIPSRHNSKEIVWKEMFAVLHAFLLWHEAWRNGKVRLACDNTSVVDAINKRSIRGPAIIPLQRIFLIAAVYDIEILPFWIPSGENVVADAASRQDYKKLADLGLQVSPERPRPSDLRRKLHSFFTTPSLRALGKDTIKSFEDLNHSVNDMNTLPTQPPSKQFHIGSPRYYPPSSQQLPDPMSVRSDPSTLRLDYQLPRSKTHVLNSLFVEEGESTAKASSQYDTPSRLISSFACSKKSETTRRESTLKQPSVWVLPPSYDLENLRGISGPRALTTFSYPVTTSLSTLHP
jgi:hypothetical protein